MRGLLGSVRPNERRTHIGVAATYLEFRLFGRECLVNVENQRARWSWLCHVLPLASVSPFGVGRHA